MTRGTLRKSLVVAGASVALLGGGTIVSVYGLPHIIGKVLHGNGFPDAYVDGVSFTPFGIYIDHVSLDAHEFSIIDQVSVSFSWGDLLRNQKIDRVSVKNIELTGELDDSGQIKIAGWDATPPSSGGKGALLPLSSLLIQGATLDLDTPEGNIRLEGKLSLETDDRGVTQTASFSSWGKQKQLSFTLNGNGKFSENGVYDYSVELLEGRVDIPRIEMSRLSGWVSAAKTSPSLSPQYSGQVSAGRVKVGNALLQNIDFTFDTTKSDPLFFKTSPAGFPDIVLAGRWNRDPPQQFEITLESKRASDLVKILSDNPDQKLLNSLKNISPLTIQLAIPPSSFEKGSSKDAAWAVLIGGQKTKISGVASYHPESGVTDVTLLPTTILSARDVSLLLPSEYSLSLKGGDIGIGGKFSVSSTPNGFSVSGPVSFDIASLSGDWNGVLFSDLTGKVGLPSLWPWNIGQSKLSYSLLGKAGPIGSGKVSLRGNSSEGLSVSDMSLDVAGGHVKADPFTLFSSSGNKTEVMVSLDRLKMDDLSKISSSDSFMASGIISGTIPIVISDAGLSFKGGKISNVGNGSFKYAPDQFPPSLQGDDPRMQTVREALSDFQFSELSLDLNGPMDGHMTTSLKANGTSPLFGDRPIVLNLNLEGDLGKVLRSTLQAGDIGATLRSVNGAEK